MLIALLALAPLDPPATGGSTTPPDAPSQAPTAPAPTPPNPGAGTSDKGDQAIATESKQRRLWIVLDFYKEFGGTIVREDDATIVLRTPEGAERSVDRNSIVFMTQLLFGQASVGFQLHRRDLLLHSMHLLGRVAQGLLLPVSSVAHLRLAAAQHGQLIGEVDNQVLGHGYSGQPFQDRTQLGAHFLVGGTFRIGVQGGGSGGRGRCRTRSSSRIRGLLLEQLPRQVRHAIVERCHMFGDFLRGHLVALQLPR